MIPYAEILDNAYGGSKHMDSLSAQKQKVENPDLTPSARVLEELKQSGLSFQDFTMQQSLEHKDFLNNHKLSAEALTKFQNLSKQTIQQQNEIEANETIDFDTYVQQFHKLLDAH